jgi:hypothetical protein
MRLKRDNIQGFQPAGKKMPVSACEKGTTRFAEDGARAGIDSGSAAQAASSPQSRLAIPGRINEGMMG